MFASAIRLCSQGLHDVPEVLLIWSLNNSYKVGCGKRFYHNLKKTSCSKVNTLHGKYNIHLDSVKRAFSNINSAFSTSFDLNRNGSSNAEEFLRKHSVTVQGNNPVNPVFSIEDTGFPEDIISVLRKNGLDDPTPIQCLSWPHALQQRDFVGISQTGSGKTLGYIIPAIIHVRKLRKDHVGSNSPLALVLVPTRELAQQVWNVARMFTDFSVKVVCIYGGASKGNQASQLSGGVDICIATPGRLLDFIRNGVLSLRRCSFVVIDEADRMLDMGFLPDTEKIMHENECQKQVLLWSATWPKQVEAVAEKFLSDYVMAAVGSTDLKPNSNVHQIVEIVDSRDKDEKLFDLLRDISSIENYKVLIFAETKFGVDGLKYTLYRNRITAEAIHSGKTQATRERIIASFREGRCRVLIATALAARGLHVDNITHVINYDCPKYEDEYIHKIGRTGRLDKTGTAITFVTPADTSSAYLIDMLKVANQEVPKELYNIGLSRKISFNDIRPKKYFNKPRPRYKRY